ncbi:MAG TPA: ParB/RepB/Spo0J family partition protein, partial [Polyangia bacterium]
MNGKRRALGRGLAALIPEAGPPPSSPVTSETAIPAGLGAGEDKPLPEKTRGLYSVGIEEVRPGPHQPRKTFADAQLEELAESIRTQGIIQPLVVRRAPDGDGYELIAGERRWRAAQRAGLHEVPVVVREVADREAFEMALVENLQRADLNP